MRVIAFLLMICLLSGCRQSNDIPAGIIPKSKMETILWQLMQTDEFVTYALLKDSIKGTDQERIKLYQQVFTLNKVKKEEFSKSYKYYMGHPEISKVMFDSLATRANRSREESNKPKSDTTVEKKLYPVKRK
jgi:hypothetical protein